MHSWIHALKQQTLMGIWLRLFSNFRVFTVEVDYFYSSSACWQWYRGERVYLAKTAYIIALILGVSETLLFTLQN
jgi:hypothetical protein